ncbi:hypothetical protein CMUS01_09513 [Colletotrichum musicola]|uniref:Uncharacterized protein n=1 Tax=Colletotrichum musicola TaxID=2175873 RepID=A0A8H6K8T5_9PEZI|nr:hypothetical protein CMUS01_09513 [Colletotrichum musicola]
MVCERVLHWDERLHNDGDGARGNGGSPLGPLPCHVRRRRPSSARCNAGGVRGSEIRDPVAGQGDAATGWTPGAAALQARAAAPRDMEETPRESEKLGESLSCRRRWDGSMLHSHVEETIGAVQRDPAPAMRKDPFFFLQL